MINMLVSVQMLEETNTPITSVLLENTKKGTSHYNKTIFKIRLAMYNLIYQAVRNIRHILSNYINNQCILSQIVNDNLLNSLTISVFSFIPKLNLIISVMNIVYWMIAKLVMFGVWKLLSIYEFRYMSVKSRSFLELCLDIIITVESHIENLSNVKFMIFTNIFEFKGKDQILRKRYVLVILILHIYLLAHCSFKFPIPMVSKLCAAIHESYHGLLKHPMYFEILTKSWWRPQNFRSNDFNLTKRNP